MKSNEGQTSIRSKFEGTTTMTDTRKAYAIKTTAHLKSTTSKCKHKTEVRSTPVLLGLARTSSIEGTTNLCESARSKLFSFILASGANYIKRI